MKGGHAHRGEIQAHLATSRNHRNDRPALLAAAVVSGSAPHDILIGIATEPQCAPVAAEAQAHFIFRETAVRMVVVGGGMKTNIGSAVQVVAAFRAPVRCELPRAQPPGESPSARY